MIYKIIYTEKFKKSLEKIDKSNRDIILKWIGKRVLNSANPKSFGKALSEDKKGFWRYRIGNYRLICKILEKELIVLFIEAGNRKDIYKNKK